MRQRVAIGRALAIDTPIVLMDEPFGALDEQTRLLMGEWLLDIWRRTRKTVVFVTHGLHEALALSTRVVVMTARPGRIKSVLDLPMPYPRAMDGLEMVGAARQALGRDPRRIPPRDGRAVSWRVVRLVERGAGGRRARGARARPHGSPVAVSRSGRGSLGPPIPRGGWAAASSNCRRLARRTPSDNGDNGSP